MGKSGARRNCEGQVKLKEKRKLQRLFSKHVCCDCGINKRFNLWNVKISVYFENNNFITRKTGYVYCKDCFKKLKREIHHE